MPLDRHTHTHTLCWQSNLLHTHLLLCDNTVTTWSLFLPDPCVFARLLCLSGKIEFGVINQSSSAFNHILNDVSLVVYQVRSCALGTRVALLHKWGAPPLAHTYSWVGILSLQQCRADVATGWCGTLSLQPARSHTHVRLPVLCCSLRHLLASVQLWTV